MLRAPDIQFGDLEFKCRSDRQLDLLIYKTFVDLQNTTIRYCSKRSENLHFEKMFSTMSVSNFPSF